MALITKIAEVRKCLLITSLDDETSLPDISAAEIKYILPALGKRLYDEVVTAYETASLDADMEALIAVIQKPLAAFAYLDNLGLIHARITSAGIRRFGTDEMPSAYAWEFREVKKALAGKAADGMEQLYTFLEYNASKWPAWEESPARIIRRNLLISNGNEFAANYPLSQPLRTYSALLPIIVEVQDNYIIPSIGIACLRFLLTLSGPDDKQKEVIRLLRKCVAHYSIKHAVEQLPVELSEVGFTVVVGGSSADVEQPGKMAANVALLESKKQAADRDGGAYLRKARAFLNQHASHTVFPDYYNSQYYIAPGMGAFDRGNERRRIFRF